jgi:hypothetical protein
MGRHTFNCAGFTHGEAGTAMKKCPRDPNQLGKLIIDIATGQVEDRLPTPEEQGKDPAAVALGRRGCLNPRRYGQIALQSRPQPVLGVRGYIGELDSRTYHELCSLSVPGREPCSKP